MGVGDGWMHRWLMDGSWMVDDGWIDGWVIDG